MPKKQNVRDLRAEVRSRFEQFIVAELQAKPDVSTTSLAQDFYKKEEPVLRKIAHVTIVNILVKWADDILGQSIGREAARNGHPQLALPMSLEGIELPGAYSFINGANALRFVASYKTEWFHLESHDYILRKHEAEVRAGIEQHGTLMDAVRPLMEGTKLTLADALQSLCDGEAGAA